MVSSTSSSARNSSEKRKKIKKEKNTVVFNKREVNKERKNKRKRANTSFKFFPFVFFSEKKVFLLFYFLKKFLFYFLLLLLHWIFLRSQFQPVRTPDDHFFLTLYPLHTHSVRLTNGFFMVEESDAFDLLSSCRFYFVIVHTLKLNTFSTTTIHIILTLYPLHAPSVCFMSGFFAVEKMMPLGLTK